MENNYEKLRRLLAELFQLEQADLDFGIYRIMNQKRDEIMCFLDNDLLPQVQEAFQEYQGIDRTNIEAQLNETIKQIKSYGMDPEASPKVQELRKQLSQAVDVAKLESEVFSNLYDFFRRYYSEGDFLSLRRYKEGVYAIPYEGEEVKLYWANHDQYYVKTSEYFRDYAFKLPSGKRVHFKLVEADTEKDNQKAEAGKERRFTFFGEDPLAEVNGELHIRFEYKPDPDKSKQEALNSVAIRAIMNTSGFSGWKAELAQPMPTESNPNRTLLEKHLNDYTARNTFDYFIHKDLGGFLRRELDFYIKNEVMHLDDIESESVPKVEQYLSKIKVIRKIAHKIIEFLTQIENFQKKLWLKKKFVVETNYCVTLDRVPEELYPEIIANDAQSEEWVRLFAIDEIDGDLATPKYSVPLTEKFLKANPYLVLDTQYFSQEFKDSLLGYFENIDEHLEGLLIHSENFQALNLLINRYCGKINCIYIDPPYNTDASAIIYKNDYKNSSWITLMHNRLHIAKDLLSENGILCAAIDDEEASELRFLLDGILSCQLGIAVVRSNPAGRKTKGRLAPAHEYALFYGKSLLSIPMSLDVTEGRLSRYPHKDSISYFAWANFIRSGSGDKRTDRPTLFYPIFVSKDNRILIPAMVWNDIKGEYDLLEQPKNGEEVIYPVVKQGTAVIEKRWHRSHERAANEIEEYRVRRSPDGEISIDFKTRIDEQSLPITWWGNKEYASANYGAVQLKALFGDKPFDFAKAVQLVTDSIIAAGGRAEDALILDYFAGSGTTGHAVIDLNLKDGNRRKFILVEIGEHFDTVLLPRIKKVIFSPEWKDGKPLSRKGSSHLFKYIRLESYEDTLNNLELKQTPEQDSLLAQSQTFRESYMLSYMLDVESKDSPSLLNVDAFEDPFNYKLKIATSSAGETKPVTVDLVETFNYLLGLTVQHVDHIRGIRVVQGTNPEGEKVLVIWRNLREKSNEDLEEFFRKQEYNPKDMEFDLIYVNGDNNLENIRRPDETWKVRLIEEDFKRLMFDVENI